MSKIMLHTLAFAGLAFAVFPAMAADPAQLPQGEAVFHRWCAACHDPGPGHPGTQALALKFGGSVPEALKDRSDLSPETVEYCVRHGVSSMPFFRKTEIGDADLRALSNWIGRNAK